MSGPQHVTVRQLTRSGEILVLAMEPLDDAEFFQENPNGFSAAWVTGHLACFADLFASWFTGKQQLPAEMHQVFNDTAMPGPPETSKAATVDPDAYPKDFLLLCLRRSLGQVLDLMSGLGADSWDAPAPQQAPVTLATQGAVMEHLAVHVYWHLGELAGSMPRFAGTYALNILPHHLYRPAADRRPG